MTLEAKELFKEKSVWEVLWACRKIALSRVNYWTGVVTFLILGVYGTCCVTTEFLIQTTRDLAKYWLPVGLNTLGFLVSGFAVYTALGKPSLFVQMAQRAHVPSGLTWLKYVLFVFLEVLIFYVVFSLFCALIVVLCDVNGPIPHAFAALGLGEGWRWGIALIGFVSVGLGIVASVLSLHAYIYNIYSSVMNCVKWESDQIDEAESAKKRTDNDSC
ncbi:MAG: hypothetical protein QM790_16190 [Nibricoccus sp.]